MNDMSVVRAFLRSIGENVNREGLKDTPARVVKMWSEVFKGYDKAKRPKLTTFPNGADGLKYDQMIIDKGYFFSHCEHHLVPFFGSYHFAYVPSKLVIGLSKVARVVDYYASKLQIQERLVKEVVDCLEQALEPSGIALVMKARHLCKEMRGIKQINGEMITSDLRGVFQTNQSARAEFMSLIANGR